MIQVRWLVILVAVGWMSVGTADGRDRRSGKTVQGSGKDPRRNNLTVFLVVILSAAKDLPCNYREILRCAQNDSRAK